MDETPPPSPGPVSNVPEYSVAEISSELRRSVEERFAHVRVRGEISGFKRHSSGHLYFCLKDAEAVLDAVCWRGSALKLGIVPEDGIEVLATGRLTTYPGRSKYQMVVERIELAGQGAALKLLEDRKRKLAAEGLFDTGRKKPIPYLPRVIGVVTSPTGAVIRDILHRLGDRFPCRVLLWPVAVQGEGAAAQVAAAIDGFNAIAPGGPVPRPDLLIVARGGGSVEDLWAFNEEVVVRAAARSAIPLISGVGHETDTTLIDFASDRRAPTPSAAAEMAVPVRLELLGAVADAGLRLAGAIVRGLDARRTRLDHLSRALPNPRLVIEDCRRRLDDRAERLDVALPGFVRRREAELHRLAARLRHPRELLAEKRFQTQGLGTRLAHALERALAPERRRLEIRQAGERLGPAMRRLLADRGQRLDSAGKLLESFSYHNVLERGFAVVRDATGAPITSTAEARKSASLFIEFKDGKVQATVADEPTRKPPARGDGRQGSLL